jgi:hypothetical protein
MLHTDYSNFGFDSSFVARAAPSLIRISSFSPLALSQFLKSLIGLSPDLFDLFRYTLTCVVGIYATIVTLQSLYNWFVILSSGEKYISMARRYLIVHGLRLRFATFWSDLVICGLLCVVLGLIWRAHILVDRLDQATRTATAGSALTVNDN